MNRQPILSNKNTRRTISKPGARKNSNSLKVMSLAKTRDATGVPGTRRVAAKKAAAAATNTKGGKLKVPRRGDLNADGTRRSRSQDETRDSTRQQARGRSELTGRMNRRVNSERQHRVSKTGTKSK